jgi:tripartite-type tricarboxylate transporter receptor subunit TctC
VPSRDQEQPGSRTRCDQQDKLPSLPDVPTFGQEGVNDIELSGWGMFLVPSSTPAPVVARLNGALVAVMAAAKVRGRIDDLGAKTTSSTPGEAREMLLSEIAKWAKIVEAAQARVEN